VTAFLDHFSKIYGPRWESLYPALLAPSPKVERSCFSGFAHYFLDPASIRAAQALQVRPGEQVLDLCAAPGGKTLILAESLFGGILPGTAEEPMKSKPEISRYGFLVANELSSDRRRRLKEVLESHMPALIRGGIEITGYDGNQFGLRKPGKFHRVLLDAPCSSERHLLEADPLAKEWRPTRTRQLFMRQYSLICSAVLALKRGGTLVYSTCSISPEENDGVIERLLKRKGDQVKLDPETSDLDDLERTRFGFQIFPDRAGGAGPIFISRLLRTAPEDCA